MTFSKLFSQHYTTLIAAITIAGSFPAHANQCLDTILLNTLISELQVGVYLGDHPQAKLHLKKIDLEIVESIALGDGPVPINLEPLRKIETIKAGFVEGIVTIHEMTDATGRTIGYMIRAINPVPQRGIQFVTLYTNTEGIVVEQLNKFLERSEYSPEEN